MSTSLKSVACITALTAVLLPLNLAFAEPARSSIDKINHIVVIYAENRSFDNLYGLFPGARGIGDALHNYLPQIDNDGRAMATLPPVWREDGKADPAFPAGLPNLPFRIDAAPIDKPLGVPTRDIVHRFYQQQEQINHGSNDRFAAVSDAGGLVMGYYDGSHLPLWKWANEFALADNFFMGAFGGSFLNHFWLICACTPEFKDAPDEMRAHVDAEGKLLRKPGSPASPHDGPPQLQDGAVTPDGFGVNTLQSSFQPSGTAPGANLQYADPAKHPLPPQTAKTIGDTLTAANISWAWYAGGWNRALADRSVIYNGGKVNFQPHHQPFNYFSRFAPGTRDRKEHLKDGADFLAAIEKGTLPKVAFYKPQGDLNEHPGYADVLSGDAHIAEILEKIRHSRLWKDTVVIVTYDENGGFWDHVAPPAGDRWGPGSRVPALIVSPLVHKHFVDHSLYDTTSILKLITRRFSLEPLAGVRANVGDLSGAFE